MCLNPTQCSALTGDDFGRALILLYKNILNFNTFCSQKSNTFSSVHLLAASNMFHTISSLFKLAPMSVLNCANKDGVTPLYLAHIFGASETIQEFEKHTKYFKLPDESFERILLLKLVSSFIDSNSKHSLFHLQQYVPTFSVSTKRGKL